MAGRASEGPTGGWVPPWSGMAGEGREHSQRRALTCAVCCGFFAASTSTPTKWTHTVAAATPSAPMRNSWCCPAQTPKCRDSSLCSPCWCSAAAHAAPSTAETSGQSPSPPACCAQQPTSWPQVTAWKSPQTRLAWMPEGKGLPGSSCPSPAGCKNSQLGPHGAHPGRAHQPPTQCPSLWKQPPSPDGAGSWKQPKEQTLRRGCLGTGVTAGQAAQGREGGRRANTGIVHDKAAQNG